MANFKQLNKLLEEKFPSFDIEAVRGEGYIYFDGDDGFDKINSIFIEPTKLSTSNAFRECCVSIHETYGFEPKK